MTPKQDESQLLLNHLPLYEPRRELAEQTRRRAVRALELRSHCGNQRHLRKPLKWQSYVAFAMLSALLGSYLIWSFQSAIALFS
jgi:ADP-ribose pyrophosphatase YjhB (NUDIX family)